MERLKSLDRYQKVILLLMAAMVLVFAILYPITISRMGFFYQDTILLPSQETGSTVYAGTIKGTPARFTVSADQTVTFRYGDQTYGPYTAKLDPTAVPKDENMHESMTGVEVRNGEILLFRGGVLDTGESFWLFSEDGSSENIIVSTTMSNGTVMANGEIIDPMEPSVSTILKLMEGPELTHKGTWPGLFGGIFFCILTAISMLFADELFRFDLSFRISNADQAEPSDWVIAGRYISWIVLPTLALVLFILGLQ